MIKIDGEKIKAQREKLGLTQLYMATAVGVTTDTISRWENKRYPTIKEENAEKLAEALEVEVEDILLVDDEGIDNEAEINAELPEKPKTAAGRFSLVAVISAALLLLGIAGIAGHFLFKDDGQAKLQAERIMPQRTLPGSPFPVVILVHHDGEKALSIILKESLPKGSEIIEASPSSGSSTTAGEMKWIKKVKGTTRFSYLIKINDNSANSHTFEGTISTSTGEDNIGVTGNNLVEDGPFHWADTNGDNSISDQEILTVFDYYSGIDDFTVGIELIEKMWLGSKYTWDSQTQQITITP